MDRGAGGAWSGNVEENVVYLVSINPVRDFASWKTTLDSQRHVLTRYRVRRHWLFRGSDDPNEVMTVFELPAFEDAERLLRSVEVDMPAWMDRAGLTIYPSFFIGEPVDVVNYTTDEAAGKSQGTH